MSAINNKSEKEVLKDLKGLKCMAALSPELMTQLARSGVKRSFRSNEFIWKMGDPGDFVGVIVDGLVEIRRYTSRDEETSMGIFGPSDVIGLSAVMNKKSYPGDAKAVSPGTSIVKLYFRPLLQLKTAYSSELHVWLREMFLHHEQILRDKIDILNAGQIEDRVFEFLTHLARRFGEPESKVSYRIPLNLTRSQVGHMVNGRVETIIRLMSRWQKKGLIKWTSREIVIPDLPLLEKSLRCRQSLK